MYATVHQVHIYLIFVAFPFFSLIEYIMLHMQSTSKNANLPEGRYLVGRCPPSQILLTERTVSAGHCLIWHQSGSWYVRDLSSTNGTYLDGSPLIPEREYLLPVLCTLKLGNIFLKLEWNDLRDVSDMATRFPIILLARNEATTGISKKTTQAVLAAARQSIRDDLQIDSLCKNMKQLYREAEELAHSRLPIAIEGETGSGKELLARFIHQCSGRSGQMITIVPVTSESLQESEFFGYRKGAFTGADRDYPGKIKLADQGTLFLDELSHIPTSLQIRLLRFLENGEIFPLGAHKSEFLDVRLLAASNVPFRELVRLGQLRQDVYYRLCAHTLSIPPLRERKEDVLPLFIHFLNNTICDESALFEPKDVPAKMADTLRAYPWPGNIRELKTEAQRVKLRLNGARFLGIDLLSPIVQNPTPVRCASNSDPFMDEDEEAVERTAILEALQACRGNKTRTAIRLRISRRGLYKKMERLGII